MIQLLVRWHDRATHCLKRLGRPSWPHRMDIEAGRAAPGEQFANDEAAIVEWMLWESAAPSRRQASRDAGFYGAEYAI